MQDFMEAASIQAGLYFYHYMASFEKLRSVDVPSLITSPMIMRLALLLLILVAAQSGPSEQPVSVSVDVSRSPETEVTKSIATGEEASIMSPRSTPKEVHFEPPPPAELIFKINSDEISVLTNITKLPVVVPKGVSDEVEGTETTSTSIEVPVVAEGAEDVLKEEGEVPPTQSQAVSIEKEAVNVIEAETESLSPVSDHRLSMSSQPQGVQRSFTEMSAMTMSVAGGESYGISSQDSEFDSGTSRYGHPTNPQSLSPEAKKSSHPSFVLSEIDKNDLEASIARAETLHERATPTTPTTLSKAPSTPATPPNVTTTTAQSTLPVSSPSAATIKTHLSGSADSSDGSVASVASVASGASTGHTSLTSLSSMWQGGDHHVSPDQLIRKSVTTPSVLVGKFVDVTGHKSGYTVGEVMEVKKNFGSTTEFVVNFPKPQGGISKWVLPLKRSERKGTVPFTVVEESSLFHPLKYSGSNSLGASAVEQKTPEGEVNAKPAPSTAARTPPASPVHAMISPFGSETTDVGSPESIISYSSMFPTPASATSTLNLSAASLD